ncbi:hypothetical protein [Streptomyces sp. N2A]|uniref:hypothetical protein n=1 Tax=Streptomyces sp. N2A TaxID=3073936 RepID=UPI002870860D|nr:hypothetical protein [Streptomyces sp. N2A]
MADRCRIKTILSRARERTDAAAYYPELGNLRMKAGLPYNRSQGRGRSTRHLTQREMSLLLGWVWERQDWYKRLELGTLTQPELRTLQEVSTLLCLDLHEWEQLHIALFGRKPAETHNPDAGVKVAPTWSHIIHTSPVAAYISNRCWDVVDFNPTADRLWGGMPDNVLRALLGLPHGRHERSTYTGSTTSWGRTARRQLELLGLPPQPPRRKNMIDWPSTWGPDAMAGLRNGRAVHPQDATLRQIEAEVYANAELLALYEGRRVAGSRVHARTQHKHAHPDGTQRLMYNPALDKIGIMEGAVSEPLGAPGARVVWMEWRPLEAAKSPCNFHCDLYHLHQW